MPRLFPLFSATTLAMGVACFAAAFLTESKAVALIAGIGAFYIMEYKTFDQVSQSRFGIFGMMGAALVAMSTCSLFMLMATFIGLFGPEKVPLGSLANTLLLFCFIAFFYLLFRKLGKHVITQQESSLWKVWDQ